MGQDKVQGHQLAEDGVPFRGAPVAIVFFADRRVQRPGRQMKDMAVSPVGQHPDMFASHAAGKEADRRLTVGCAGERHVLAPEEVPPCNATRTRNCAWRAV